MATYSTILAWEIPWIEEHGRLQTMGCKELDTTEGLSTGLGKGVEWEEEKAFDVRTEVLGTQL